MQPSAIVSGAGGALGSVIVKKLLSEGYHVSGLFHHENPESTENFKPYNVNLLDEEETAAAVKAIFDERKEVKVLVCTAGGFRIGNIGNTTSAQIQQQIDLNFKTTYHLVQPVYNRMKAQGYGRIFITASKSALKPEAGVQTLAYTISKAMLVNLATILNADNPHKVVTTIIAPSIIDTKANRDSMPDADTSKWVTPEQIADVIAFYISEKAEILREPVLKAFHMS
ncbi:MAG: SDR family NAD(P)-dependent oxidoreductase [Chitinophagaceae bacterium]|nr:SDR family NAD(P)-dependent oxidoreductase [Chitinophagaceae bacterium]